MSRPSTLKVSLITCLLLGVAALGATGAGARDVDMYDSKVTLANSKPAFHGKVKSEHGPCKNNRHVAVFRKRNGPDNKLGGDLTGQRGRWEIPVMLSSGAYYSRVRPKQQIVSGNGYTCAKDKSLTLVID